MEERGFKISFLLIDGFSMISFASAIDPLRIANKLLGTSHFHYNCTSLDGNPVASSSGLEIKADFKLQDLPGPDLLIVTSSDGVEQSFGKELIGDCLRRLERHGTSLGAICTGSYLLANFGLLRGRACTVHWEYFDIAKEAFPEANFRSQLFTQDSGLLTAAGGTAPVDLMVGIIAQRFGEGLANQVRDVAIHHIRREGSKHQRLEVHSRYNVYDPHVVECLELMEMNIENSLKISEICKRVGLTMRQIQRLFMRELGQSPNDCYSALRLDHARYLVQHTTMNIQEITLAAGFTDRSHFARKFKKKFGASPSEFRKKQHPESIAR